MARIDDVTPERRQQMLNEIFTYLRSHGYITSIKDFAEKIGCGQSGLSSAMNGDKRYLSKNLFIYKIAPRYREVFNFNWLETGEGEMLVPMHSQKMGDVHGVGIQASEGAKVVMSNDSELKLEIERLKAQVQLLKEQNAILLNIIKSRLDK